MTKALGMTIYLRDDTTTSGSYTTVCATSVEGGGYEASAESLEPCLDDTVILEFPADPKYGQITVEYKRVDSTAAANTTTVTYNMEQACKNTTLCLYGYKIPLSPTPVYGTRTVYVISHTDLPKERNQDMKSSIVLAPQSEWTYSTNVPS